MTSSHSASSVVEVGGAEVDATFGGQPLDGLEPPAELGRRRPGGQLGVDAGVTGDVDDGGQHVAELVGDAILDAAVDGRP